MLAGVLDSRVPSCTRFLTRIGYSDCAKLSMTHSLSGNRRKTPPARSAGLLAPAEVQASKEGIRAVTQEIKLPFTALPSFPYGHLSDRPPYIGVGIGRNGADSEPSSGGGLSAPSNETISERPVTARWRRELPSPVVTAERTTLPPTLLTPQRNPHGKNNVGVPEWPRIGVTAAWHRQQSHPSQPTSIPPDSYRGDARWDCKPETPTARESPSSPQAHRAQGGRGGCQ